jgi:hypothetical protein
MKKALFLFITAACLSSFSASAQKTQVGLSAGVVSSNVMGDKGGINYRGDARAGMTLGILIDAPIGKTNISFQPAVHYVQKGMYTNKTEAVREADALRYADFLLNFVYYLGGAERTRLYFGLGPQIGFNLPSKKIMVEDGDKSELRSILFGETAADDYRGLDYGANALVGIRFKKGVTFTINYTLGLRNLIPIPAGSDNLRNGYVGFRVGYMFKNTPGK